MQFAFTDEQELLRREARDVLANGGWGKADVAELGFLDRAVLYEEAGRANRGEEFFEEDAPENERLAALSLEAVGIGAKALELAIEYAKTREQFGKASPGSTCCTCTTSARSGFRRTPATRRSTARASPHTCWIENSPRHGRIVRDRSGVRRPAARPRLARARGRSASRHGS